MIEIPKDFNPSDQFKLQFNVEHNYPKGSFNQKYIDHFCNGIPLRDMQEFTVARQHYQEFGKYCLATPNSHPSSQWMKFWKEEAKRCIYGYNIGRDWISGYNYFYWNYTPIQKVNEATLKDLDFDFPDIWDGDYFYFHYLEECEKTGKHASLLKRRRWGASWKSASMMNRNFFLIPRSKSYAIADNLEYLTKDGLLNKTWDILSWVNSNTAWDKKMQKKDTDIHKKASFEKTIPNGAKIEMGYKSEIIGITLKGDKKKVRGKQGKLLIYEEAGSNPILSEAWMISKESMQQDKYVFGLMIATGTGGEGDSNFDGLDKLNTKPEGYKILSIPNIFDGKQNELSGMFVPIYLNMAGCYDKDGNTNIIKAITEEDYDRKGLKKSLDINAYLQSTAERPYNTDECKLIVEGSPFDIATVRQALGDLKTKNIVQQHGEFSINREGKVEFVAGGYNTPIEEYPLKNNTSTNGCWVIWEKPQDTLGQITYGRYLAGNDPIDFGTDDVSSNTRTHSLSSCFIIDSFTRNIVAEYTGRPKISDEYYEQLWRGIEYYNAQLLYESNLRGLYVYFKNKNKTHLLAFTPQILKDKYGDKYNDKVKGFKTNQKINSWARDLINMWSLEKVTTAQNEETGELVEVPRMYFIKSVPLLQEMEKWNTVGNFDRISSLGATMIILTDRMKAIESLRNPDNNKQDDKFFSRIGRLINKKSFLNASFK